jgi:hypothetical protein
MPHSQKQQQATTPSLHQAAEDNLRYIRAAMESATSFTGVSGKGYVLAGLTAVFAAWRGALQPSPAAWLAVWMLELVIAAGITLGLVARKARSLNQTMWSGSGRKLFMAFLPAMSVGALLTLAFFLQGYTVLLPGIWLSLYGAAVMTAGAHSIRLIPVMGALFITLGGLMLLGLVPLHLALGLGFGGLHIVFGLIIWRHHGG